ncbi:phage antirepressor KilAC domain-containing protein [Enterococcus sp. 2201sp1_2201st1_B8_2201SCRN_220225]|uniref:phage antirepressor KilAC domain-containing protein n=1 Tax=unclassified Enterococcus TaxID=2608891 RepID=UPI0034A388EC
MNELIKVTTNENDEQLVSARELHKALDLKIRFSLWWEKNNDGLLDGEDFTSVSTDTVVNNGAVRRLQDYALTLDSAKHLAMQSKTEKGREVRAYFIKIEKAWNNPEMVVQRALQIQTRKVEALQLENAELKPKALFADAVDASKTSILIGDLAKLIKQNGVDIGQNRLFEWLRQNGFLISRKGESYNMPTQRSAEMGLIEIKERTHNNPDGSIRISRTPKVTGKGQVYFVNKFLAERTA